MQRFSTFLSLLLFLYVSCVWCSPEEAAYEDVISNLGDDEFPPLYDDSDSGFQPLLDSTPDLISAGSEEQCSNVDVTPNGKVRAREAACSAEQQEPSAALDIPNLDILHDTNYLCPYDMKYGFRFLVCGKPVSIEGLTPDILTTVEDARLCKLRNAERRL